MAEVKWIGAQNAAGFKTGCARIFVHLAGNGYQAVFRAGEGEGSEEEEWHLTSVTPLPGEVD